MWARDRSRCCWWAGRESNPHSRRRLVYSQRSSPPAQPTHCGDGPLGETAVSGSPVTGNVRYWSRRRDSNPEPAVYKTAALPIELRRRDAQGRTAVDPTWRRGMIGPDGSMGQARGVPGARGFRGFATGSAGGPPGRRSSSPGAGVSVGSLVAFDFLVRGVRERDGAAGAGAVSGSIVPPGPAAVSRSAAPPGST